MPEVLNHIIPMIKNISSNESLLNELNHHIDTIKKFPDEYINKPDLLNNLIKLLTRLKSVIDIEYKLCSAKRTVSSSFIT